MNEIRRRDDRRSRWALELYGRRGANAAAVALANKNAQTTTALMPGCPRCVKRLFFAV